MQRCALVRKVRQKTSSVSLRQPKPRPSGRPGHFTITTAIPADIWTEEDNKGMSSRLFCGPHHPEGRRGTPAVVAGGGGSLRSALSFTSRIGSLVVSQIGFNRLREKAVYSIPPPPLYWRDTQYGNCNRSDRWIRTRIRCSRVDFPPTASSGETATFLLTARVRRRAAVKKCPLL